MRRRRLLREERGTTMPELLVGMSTGTVVMLGLIVLVIVTLHTTARVSARVDATQRARIALNQVLNPLHSACIAPKVAPIRQQSTDTQLRFVHATGSQVSPTPTLTVVSLIGTTLSQKDYAYVSGIAPFWVFNEVTPIASRELLTHISPVSAGAPVFSYYGSSNGALAATPLSVPLSEYDASRTIHVNVAFKASPKTGPGADDATPARMQGGASLRLTAPSYNKEAPSLPCQ
jgi:Tfp pilus assembly protein PilV